MSKAKEEYCIRLKINGKSYYKLYTGTLQGAKRMASGYMSPCLSVDKGERIEPATASDIYIMCGGKVFCSLSDKGRWHHVD